MAEGVSFAVAAIIASQRKIIAFDLPSSHTLGPQFDLKTALTGPTGIQGLRFRASLTYVQNPYLRHSAVSFATQAPGEPRLLYPVITRLQGFFGLQYDCEP